MHQINVSIKDFHEKLGYIQSTLENVKLYYASFVKSSIGDAVHIDMT